MSKMKLQDVAKIYINLNVFNLYTADKINTVAKVFDLRSGCNDIQHLEYEHLINFKNETLNVAKPVTYNGYLGYLRLLGKFMVDEGYISENIFNSLRRASLNQESPKVIAEDTLKKVSDHMHEFSHRYKPVWFWLTVIRFFYLTGVRRRQLVHIRIKDVDLERCILTLRREGSKTQREWSIALAVTLVDDLVYLMKRSSQELGRALNDDDPLFNICWFNSAYKPYEQNPCLMNPTSITGFFKRLSRGSGIRLGAHRFRHTMATNLCNGSGNEREVDLFTIQSILGHTSLNTTRRYVQSDINRMSGMINQLECAI